jgi:hypothetical protein
MLADRVASHMSKMVWCEQADPESR